MMIRITSPQYRLVEGTLALMETTPELGLIVSDPLLPAADWARMLLDQELSTQQARLDDGTAEGLEITKTGKFLFLLSDLTLFRTLDNSSIFLPMFSPTVAQVTEKDLRAHELNVQLPARHKLLRIKALDRDGKPAVNTTICYQNIREVPTGFYSAKTDGNGEGVLCSIKPGSYRVSWPMECDPVHVVVDDSDLDYQEIILQSHVDT
jgi:hypothetical protein